MGLGTGALAGAGIGAAAYGAYSWGKEAVTAQEERSEIVQRARLGGVDYNFLQSLGQFAQANGIDSGMGTQGARKNLDVAKDVSEKLADGALNAKRNKQGEWTGAPTGINTALNMGYTPDQLKEWAKNPFGFVSSYTNTMQSKGLSEQEILHNLEDLGDDLGLYAKAFMNGGKALTDQVDVLKRNGQWLDEAQQDQLVQYRKFNQELSILSDSQKLAFFEGFMSEIDPETMREFKEAMQEALPFFKGAGAAAGDLVSGLIKLTNWITGKLNLLNGDNTTKEAVSQHYGTTSAPVQAGSNPVANAYGASQPKADGTHQPNVFDTFHDWWNGTSDAKDVSSYAQSTNGDYSPVSMLKQSAAAPANPDLLRLTWYGTALGLANEAAAHNDGLMPLDEVGQGADPVSVSQSAYALFNGVGKLQGAKEGGNRDLKRWRTVAISTGEMDLETFIATAGRKTKAGQLVRLLNIPLSKAVRFHDHQNGKHHADALKDAYQRHHGAAGRGWIRWLADHQQQAIDTVRECEARWRSLIPADYGEQVHRVAARFAILEAALLLGEVVTGWDAQTCRDAIQHSYNAWLREFGTGNKEHQQIIEQTEAFLNAYGFSRFAPFPYSSADMPVKDLAGYRQKGNHDSDPVIFYTFRGAFEKEIAQNFNPTQFAEVLKNAGMLKPPASGRGYQRKSPRIDGRQINVYVLTFRPEDYDEPEE